MGRTKTKGTQKTQEEVWVEAVTGGRVESSVLAPTGRSRATRFLTVELPDDSRRELVLRRDTGDGPVSGTELTLGREAKVYRALHGTGVPVPAVVAVSDDGDTMLTERAVGSEDLASLPADDQAKVIESFLQTLAHQHSLDVGDLDLPFPVPGTAAEHATSDIDMWERMLRDHAPPNPMLEFSFGWLRRRAPASVARTVLCHGDCGPGNFLHDGRSVTAVLDWEFAHFGDPMDDLAWLSMRAGIADPTALPALFDRYSELTRLDVDLASVDFYRAVVYARMAVCCAIAMRNRQRLGTANMEISTHMTLLPALAIRLPSLLAALSGTDEPTVAPPEAPPGPNDFAFEVVVGDYGSIVLPALTDAAPALRGAGLVPLLEHLRAADRYREVVEAEELADLADLLSTRPRTLEDANEELLRLVRAAGPDDDAALLQYFVRSGQRQGALWPTSVAMSAMFPSTLLSAS